MSSELIISGVTFSSSIGKALPSIPGLLSLGFFGSGGDGVNTNRAPGGPSFATIGNAPAVSSNYITLNPNNTQATATATISGGAVNAITITGGGANYVFPPIVAFSGGGGTGASATTVLSGGVVTGITNLVGGSGYTSAPTISLITGNNGGIDTGVTRASVLSAGWTWACVARVPSSGVPSELMGDINASTSLGFNITMMLQNFAAGHANNPTLYLSFNSTERAFVVLPSATAFRFYACTYSGGAGGTFNLYSVSDTLTATPYTASGISAGANQQVHLGAHTNFEGVSNCNTADMPFSMVSSGPLSLGSLQAIYTSVKSVLARRGVSVV